MSSRRSVVAFLPCRAGSVRVPRKNTRAFGPRGESLLEIKLRQLSACSGLDEIVVSTNDPEVKAVAASFAGAGAKLRVDDRPDQLASSETSTDELIVYATNVLQGDVVLWTHVTSPFLSAEGYDRILRAYFAATQSGKHDSLMTAKRLQTFLWDENGPTNYDPTTEKWPRTQTLPVLWEVDSAAFVAPLSVYREQENRVGRRPLIHELVGLESVDIDTQEQFDLASKLWSAAESNR